MKNITFGNLIEKLLYISNQKKSSLAKFIGYDVSYINKWILSTYLPSSKRINEICKNISDFIIQSLDESGLINLIDYFEIPSDSSKEYISKYIETILKEVYLDTINLNNKSVEDPLETIMKRENYEELEKTIDKTLSKFEKQVLNRFLKGESYVAIAQKLDSPVKSVDNAIQRIRKKAIKNLFKE